MVSEDLINSNHSNHLFSQMKETQQSLTISATKETEVCSPVQGEQNEEIMPLT